MTQCTTMIEEACVVEEWSCVLMGRTELCALRNGMTEKQEWCVDSWDSLLVVNPDLGHLVGDASFRIKLIS